VSTQPSDERLVRDALDALHGYEALGQDSERLAMNAYVALDRLLAALVAVRHELEGVKVQRDAFHIAAGLREEERDKAEATLVAVRAERAPLDRALIDLEIDAHYWSDRPCATCQAMTDALGRAFGCNRFAAIRAARSHLGGTKDGVAKARASLAAVSSPGEETP
jgi:hypothetical protein